jgi:putative MFS transporter
MGLAELPGLAMANILIDRIGRKFSLGIAMIGCAASSVSFGFVTTFASTTALSMCIYFFIVQAWAIIYVYTPELFPTTLRSTAFGITGVFATLAGMISSPIGGLLFDAGTDDWIILVVYSVLFVIGGLAALTLVETKKTF